MANPFRSHLTHGAHKLQTGAPPVLLFGPKFDERVWNPNLFDIERQSGTKKIF